MIDIQLTEKEIQELRSAFFAQAEDIIDNLQQKIIAIEENPDEENWKAFKRSFHTLKGDAMAMGYNSLSAFAHKVEDFIALKQDKQPDRQFVDLLFECADSLKVFLNAAIANQEPDITRMVEKIESYNGNGNSYSTSKPGIQKHAIETAKSLPFLKIEPERVDTIMNLVGELVIGRSMLSQIASDIDVMSRESAALRLENLNSSFERTLTELQRSVMKVRMLPVEIIFRRFPRLVRDLSSERGKIVKLKIEGEKTELDKSVIDLIGEPLLHIIRNAIDHGIESPDERKAAGKPEEGSLCLRAFHQGNQMIIEIEDDGRGIDVQRIKDQAVQKGLITTEDCSRMNDKEAIDIIFHSGFSTAEKITEVSGRGVGMDIVRDVIESLRGIIDVRTMKNTVTTFILRLPLTLAIIKAILFVYNNETFALPLSSVTEILRVFPEDIDTVAGEPVLKHRNGIVPLITLDNNHAQTNSGKRFVILLAVAQMRAGLITDKIIGEEELVIKALDEKASTDLTAGASILGDGRVVLILDPLPLIKKTAYQHVA